MIDASLSTGRLIILGASWLDFIALKFFHDVVGLNDAMGSRSKGKCLCIAIPMVIETVDGVSAECVARSCKRSVSLVLLDEREAICGAYVLVHQGLALRVVSAEEAASIWEAFDLAAAAIGRQEAGV